MHISEQVIEEIIHRVDILSLVSRHVELKKSGKSYRGKCPFHAENTPSFYVTPERGMYKCFGCQEGGDAIAFVQRYAGKGFVDALKELAQEVGVTLSDEPDGASEEKRPLAEASALAEKHFTDSLWHLTKGDAARKYLLSRGISLEAAKLFGLGVTLEGWTDLAEALKKAGFLAAAQQVGLIQKRPKAEGYYDTFRNRLMVPIRSPDGKTVAFGGRLLQGEGPKYLNSKESRLFSKGDLLFGMPQAREAIRKEKCAILVEGYFDCIGLHQGGFKTAVALCSTALTPGHFTVLNRADAKELVLLLDGDEAGRKAVERLASSLLTSAVPTRVASLPEGKDPDTYLRSNGAQALKQLLDGAPPLTLHLFNRYLPEGAGSSFEDKMKAVEHLKPILAGLPLGLSRSALIGALSHHSGLPSHDLESAVRGKTRPPMSAAPPIPAVSRPAPARNAHPLELSLVAIGFADPLLAARTPASWLDGLTHLGLRHFLARVARHEDRDAILFDAPSSLRDALQVHRAKLPEIGPSLDATLGEVCRKLKILRIEEQLSYIAQATQQMAAAHELNDEILILLEERMNLLTLKKKVLKEAFRLPPSPDNTNRMENF